MTTLSSGGGCGCKLGAAELLPIVQALPAVSDARLLVGATTADDAAVIRLDERLALVQTIDFFAAPVDDPYDFGRIAAANALSDIYAMGASPLSALNVVAFPLEELGGAVLGEILRGGADVCAAAGAMLVGGHSILDPEPKYGLSVTGTVDPARLVTNAGARAGDVLVLTKPLGVGAVVHAHKRGECGDELLAAAVAVMTELNGAASRAACAAGAHAMSDVTGFGLLGHLHHIARESGLGAELRASSVPALPGVEELLAEERPVSGGAARNAAWAATFTSYDDARLPVWRRRLLCDPTTSGGLLVAVSADAAASIPGAIVGQLVADGRGTIRVV